MDNRPRGREKHVSGQGGGVFRRGSGLGSGPVGRQDGYAGRREGGSGGSGGGYQGGSGGGYQGGSDGGYQGPNRAGGGFSPIMIIIVLAILLLGGGKLSGLFGGEGLSGLFGGGESGSQSGISGGNIIGSLMQNMGSLEGIFDGGSTVSEGWTQTANTGKLNTSVAPSARAKRTQLLGGGRDVVTVMVYLCGTDLESKNGMASNDLQEMANAEIGSNVNLIVFTGGCKSWKNNVVSNTANQIYKVEDGKLRCLVKDGGRDAMTKPSTLTGFIKYCKQNYPASRYELILWDHGGGSISGFGYDERNSLAGSMPLTGINEALTAAGVKFDFVGFDACLMATLETALMLDSHADYLIASEETEPGVGWYYTNWLTSLSQNTSMPTTELGKLIIDDFVSVCAKQCRGQKTTLSLIDLAELSATVPDKLKEFSSATTALMKNNGYKKVSDARSGAREFAPNMKIDQIDLAHLAYNLGTDESKALADSLLGAVKYNLTSSNITNAYGLSIFFPYKTASKLDNAVATYKAIGMGSEYSDCIQRFASLEISGQAATGGAQSPLSTLLGQGSAGTAPALGDITELLGSLMGGDLGSLSGLGDSFGFLGRNIDAENDAAYISENLFDASKLVWTNENGRTVMRLSEKQWSLVHDLYLNVFYDDGEGFIDLGLDNVYEFTEDGALSGDYDGTWLAINGQVVPYYCTDCIYDGDDYTITGRIPVLLNGERANLIIVFDNNDPEGFIAGARTDYTEGETDTAAKGITALKSGDRIDFICDYYSYDGTYSDSFLFGEEFVYTGDYEISNVYIDKNAAKATYLFTDIYNQEYWTPEMTKR